MNETDTLFPGDRVLLFEKLPYDYEGGLPLQVFPGLTLATTPIALLEKASDDHLVCFLLPSYNLTHTVNHCCLVSSVIPTAQNRDDLLFTYLAALRLIAPGYIAVSGGFQFAHGDNAIVNPTLYHTRTAWHPRLEYFYSAAEFYSAGRLLPFIVDWLDGPLTRLKYAYVLFSQVTNGFAMSYQMSMLGLYGALEAIFAPHVGNYAKLLGKRVQSFLQNVPTDVPIGEWLASHYEKERHALSHGHWQFSPDPDHRQERNADFGRLHEIVRLCLLGLLSAEKTSLQFYAQRKKTLQSALDRLLPARGTFIEGQRMWLA